MLCNDIWNENVGYYTIKRIDMNNGLLDYLHKRYIINSNNKLDFNFSQFTNKIRTNYNIYDLPSVNIMNNKLNNNSLKYFRTQTKTNINANAKKKVNAITIKNYKK